MNKIFVRILRDFVVIYLDNLNIFSRNFNKHLKHLREVFERLRNAELKLKAKKYQFFKKELTFLGYIVGEDGVKPNSGKVIAIKAYPVPTNLTELRQFLGLASYYQKFIEGFGKIAAPLNQLLKKEIEYQWNEE